MMLIKILLLTLITVHIVYFLVIKNLHMILILYIAIIQ